MVALPGQLIHYPSFTEIPRNDQSADTLSNAIPNSHENFEEAYKAEARIISIRDDQLRKLKTSFEALGKEMGLVKKSLKHRLTFLCIGGVVWVGGIFVGEWAISTKVLTLQDHDEALGLFILTAVGGSILAVALAGCVMYRILCGKMQQYYDGVARESVLIDKRELFNNYKGTFLKFATTQLIEEGGDITRQRMATRSFIDQVKQTMGPDVSVSIINSVEH